MFVTAISFPFALLSTRPLLVVTCLLWSLAMAIGVDIASARTGLLYAYDADTPALYATSLALYYLLRAIVESFPSAFLIAAALRQLGVLERGRRTTIADCVRQAWLNALYILFLLTPLMFAVTFGAPVLLRTWGYWPGTLVSELGAAVLQALVFFGFAFAWPHALVARKASLLQGLRLARGRYWKIAGVLTPVIVLMTLIAWLGQWGTALLVARLDLMPNVHDPYLDPSWLFRVAADDAARIFGSFIFATANAYLYARLMPRPEKLADAFA